MQARFIKKATDLAKDIIGKVVKEGDICADATIGNGNDTIFLCDLVSEKGKVYGFDIQDEAIKRTKEKLKEIGFLNRTILINDGHENMDVYIKDEVTAIMFNLGYLPGYNHSVTTRFNTTLEAVKKGIKLLKKNGIMTIVVYPGHREGQIEKEELLKYLSDIDQNYINVLKMEFINQINNPPFLLVIEKK